jgi:nucleotide-binding universal stress UspA family protein
MEYAIRLAHDLRLDIHYLYVENPKGHLMAGTTASGAAVEQLQRDLRKNAELARESMQERVKELMKMQEATMTVEVTTSIGNESSLVNELVKRNKAHMLMLPSKGLGETGFSRSFVDDATREVNCPVWIIPENTRYRPMNSIVYATDYQEEDISTLSRVIDLTHFVSPEITALHITDSPDFEVRIKNAGFQKVIRNKIGYDDLKVKALVEKQGADIPEMIADFASKERASLVVVLKDDKSLFERFFTESTSEKIVQESSFPVLVYHNPEA